MNDDEEAQPTRAHTPYVSEADAYTVDAHLIAGPGVAGHSRPATVMVGQGGEVTFVFDTAAPARTVR